MENLNKNEIKIEGVGKMTGESFMQKLAALIMNAAGNKSRVMEILKANINTNTICLDEYVNLLALASNNQNEICELIKDIGGMIGNELSIFEDFENVDRSRDNPVWKNHQDTFLRLLNNNRRKYNLKELKLDKEGKKLEF